MSTQSQNLQGNKAEDLNQANALNDQQNVSERTAKVKKKYHRSALYASTLIRDSVGHVKPASHGSLNL
ncbi:MAG: hypothetical protein JSS82_19655 [Bacteroidetes bacterium]|nr:hypothetical protein [Bacteroidota bacterium]